MVCTKVLALVHSIPRWSASVSTIPNAHRVPARLQALLITLGEPASCLSPTERPPWLEKGVTARVDPHIYDFYRRVAQPRACGDNWYIAEHEAAAIRLFWRIGKAHYGRELSRSEAQRCSEIVGITLSVRGPRPSTGD